MRTIPTLSFFCEAVFLQFCEACMLHSRCFSSARSANGNPLGHLLMNYAALRLHTCVLYLCLSHSLHQDQRVLGNPIYRYSTILSTSSLQLSFTSSIFLMRLMRAARIIHTIIAVSALRLTMPRVTIRPRCLILVLYSRRFWKPSKVNAPY
jgi:hypothetical protein